MQLILTTAKEIQVLRDLEEHNLDAFTAVYDDYEKLRLFVLDGQVWRCEKFHSYNTESNVFVHLAILEPPALNLFKSLTDHKELTDQILQSVNHAYDLHSYGENDGALIVNDYTIRMFVAYHRAIMRLSQNTANYSIPHYQLLQSECSAEDYVIYDTESVEFVKTLQ